MLPLDSILDFETISEIMNSGNLSKILFFQLNLKFFSLSRIFPDTSFRWGSQKYCDAAVYQRLGVRRYRR